MTDEVAKTESTVEPKTEVLAVPDGHPDSENHTDGTSKGTVAVGGSALPTRTEDLPHVKAALNARRADAHRDPQRY